MYFGSPSLSVVAVTISGQPSPSRSMICTSRSFVGVMKPMSPGTSESTANWLVRSTRMPFSLIRSWFTRWPSVAAGCLRTTTRSVHPSRLTSPQA
jgi:hypothetical protein